MEDVFVEPSLPTASQRIGDRVKKHHRKGIFLVFRVLKHMPQKCRFNYYFIFLCVSIYIC